MGAILFPLASGAAPAGGGDSPTPHSLAQAPQSGTNRDLIERVVAYFLEEEEGDEAAERVNAAGRGSDSGPLSMPLVATSIRQSVVGGSRQFHLAWIGGQPPFQLQITGMLGALNVAWQPIAARAVVAVVDLKEGPYEIRLTDAAGQSVLGGFDVVAQAPVVPEQSVDKLRADLRNAVLSAQLAAIDDGTWKLEAYQRLTALPYGPATKVTARRLAFGRSISELAREAAP